MPTSHLNSASDPHIFVLITTSLTQITIKCYLGISNLSTSQTCDFDQPEVPFLSSSSSVKDTIVAMLM